MNKSNFFIASFYILILIGISSNLSGQKNQPLKIRGTVTDSSNAKPIDFATVLIYKSGYERPLSSTYTNAKGQFTLSLSDTGNCHLIVTHGTYVEKRVDLRESRQTGELLLDHIQLQPYTSQLKDVVVKSRRLLIEHADDKVSYNVENDPIAASETTLDILRKTPFVSVDGQGNVTVNGQSNFRILLNGRETAMFSRNITEALRAFPGKLIKKIEVITAPSAKYDAEGVGGLINLITFKKIIGYNGSVSASYDIQGFRLFSTSLNLKYGKLGIAGYYTTAGQINQKYRNTESITSLQSQFLSARTAFATGQSTNIWQNGNIEISYDLDSLNTLSAYLIPGGGNNNNQMLSNISLIQPGGASFNSTYTLNAEVRYPTLNSGLDYIRKFKSNPQKEFSLRFNSDYSINDALTTSIQDNFSAADRYLTNNVAAPNNQYTLQTDFTQPLKNNTRLEIGAKGIWRIAESKFESRIKYSVNDPFLTDPQNSNNFNYTQNIYSIYGSVNFKIKDYSLRTGIRMEHTDVSGSFSAAPSIVEQNYTNILPNLFISRRYKNGGTGTFSYGLRIMRPFITNLNPFVNNNDSLRLSTGNPSLEPQTFHAINVAYRINKGQSFYNIFFGYPFSPDQIVSVSRMENVSGKIITRPDNFGRYNSYSAGLNINTNLSQKINTSIFFRLAYDQIKNTTNTLQKNQGLIGNGNFNFTYKFSPKFSSNSYFGTNLGQLNLQGRSTAAIWYGVGLSHKFLKDKLTTTLVATNFHTQYFNVTSTRRDDNFNFRNDNAYLFRGMTINIAYSFGKLQENVSKKKGVTVDDLIR